MAPLPVTATARIWFDYQTADTGREHTVQFRIPGTSAGQLADAQVSFGSVLTAFDPANLRDTWRVLRCRYASLGSTIELPLPLNTFLSTFVGTAAGSYPVDREAVEVRFLGRSTATGRKTSFALYGARANLGLSNFRYEAGSGGFGVFVAQVQAELSNPANTFVAIDGNKPVWYPYATLNYNSYWEEEIRRSG